MVSRRFVMIACLGLLAGGLSGLLPAQEFRATLSGTVTDPSGGHIPGVTVTVTHVERNTSSSAVSGDSGQYSIPFLLPGPYRVSAEMPGFKKYVRDGVILRVNDKQTVAIQLSLGDVSDTVTIVGDAPLVEAATGSRGQVVDNLKITDLPLNGRNPFTLLVVSTGVQYTGSLLFYRPFDNGAIADFSINGGRPGINEFQIDGAPNNAITGRNNIAYVPPIEATQEFKVQTNSYDSQFGRTAGGVVNVTTKAGTNQPHGTVYWYHSNPAGNANTFANNARSQPKPERRLHQYGFEVDGPVHLPRLYRGRDRTFFMFAWEGYREATPEPLPRSVPTPEMRRGDFSRAVADRSGRPLIIFDPLTTRPVNPANPNVFIRDPFPGNIIPAARIDPVARRIVEIYPLPNNPAEPGHNLLNFFDGRNARRDIFNNYITRLDHVFGERHRMYGRWHHNRRDEQRNFNGQGRAPHGDAFIPLYRQNDGFVFDWLTTFSPRTILNGRIGFTRFIEGVDRPGDGFDPTALGFPAATVAQLPGRRFPRFEADDYMTLGGPASNRTPTDTYSFQPNLSKIVRERHSLKMGFEARIIRNYVLGPGNTGGLYNFSRTFTRRDPQRGDNDSGHSMASLLLGAVNSASVPNNVAPAHQWVYYGLFFQEDWKVSRTLTLNLGLRWDYESPVTERFNRMDRGFAFDQPSPLQVPGLTLRGGLLFADVGDQPRGAFRRDLNNFQPRFGIAYQARQRLVLRGGFGSYFFPTVENGNADGFSFTTAMATSTPGFQPANFLSNPYPNGLVMPPGNSQGLLTRVGDGVTFSDPNRVVPYVYQFSGGFQYELPGNLVVDASYVGSRSRRIQVGSALNVLTLEQLALGAAVLNRTLPNPFFGVLAPSTGRGQQSTIQQQVLLLPYPHFTGVQQNNMSIGRAWYNSLQLRVEKRFSAGLSFLASYTLAKAMETTQFKNNIVQDRGARSRELSSFDRPQRLVLSGIWELPFGAGKRWLSQAPAVIQHITGGWELGWLVTVQSGVPMGFPDGIHNGTHLRLPRSQRTFDRWFNVDAFPIDPISRARPTRPAFTVRTLPLRAGGVRNHSAPDVNFSGFKRFKLSEGLRFELRVDTFNAFNTPIFGGPDLSVSSPNFGRIIRNNGQSNLARFFQVQFRLRF